MTIHEKLAANRVFAGLSPEALAPVPDAGEIVRVNAGERLIEEGQRNTHLFFLLSGTVEVRLLEGPERYSGVRLATRKAGMCIGEYAFIDKKPASATVIATEPAALLKISHKSLEALLANNPVLGRAFYRNLLTFLVGRLRANNAELDLFRSL